MGKPGLDAGRLKWDSLKDASLANVS